MAIRINKDLVARGGGVGVIKTTAAAIFIPPYVTDEKVGNSYLGTPVMDNLKFNDGTYTDLDDNEISYQGITINTVVFEVTKVRNVVKTKIQGRNGTVKEYVSDGDFQITCRGMLSNKDNVFPQDQAKVLREIFEVPQQLPIVSLFLNNVFDIFNIVIETWSMPFVEGKRNEIPFSFIAVSDVPLDLEELQ
jgi:hypothetical protein